MDFEFGTYYKSLTPTHRMDEELIVSKSLEEGVIPVEVRYGIMQGAYRGVVKSSNDLLYYFHFVPEIDSFRLVKAADPSQIEEASRLFDRCHLGCALAKGEGGAGEGSGGMGVIEEERDVADQQEDLLTDRHPGAAIGATPDRPDRGRMWHEEEVPPMAKSWDASGLLNGLNDSLRKSTSQLQRPVSNKEHQFIVEVLGRTPDEVSRGNVYMNPTQKVLYQQWLNKSMRSKIDGLSKWLKK
jgi:hypothetical protein